MQRKLGKGWSHRRQGFDAKPKIWTFEAKNPTFQPFSADPKISQELITRIRHPFSHLFSLLSHQIQKKHSKLPFSHHFFHRLAVGHKNIPKKNYWFFRKIHQNLWFLGLFLVASTPKRLNQHSLQRRWRCSGRQGTDQGRQQRSMLAAQEGQSCPCLLETTENTRENCHLTLSPRKKVSLTGKMFMKLSFFEGFSDP